MILAPLRGVTIRCFRETFAKEINEYGFTEAVTPFITANAGLDPLKDRELIKTSPQADKNLSLMVTPQFIGKDPTALRYCLERIKSAGYTTADINCGCPFPMVRNKGRGSGILRTSEVLAKMLEVGCEVMGERKFSMKARLGVERKDELLKLMPLINEFPLRYLTVHARTAVQMYEGECDWAYGEKVIAAARIPVVINGELDNQSQTPFPSFDRMIGRGFVRWLGEREDSRELLLRYIESSVRELSGDRPVLGRMKELLSYWKTLPRWSRRWNLIKICRSVDELRAAI